MVSKRHKLQQNRLNMRKLLFNVHMYLHAISLLVKSTYALPHGAGEYTPPGSAQGAQAVCNSRYDRLTDSDEDFQEFQKPLGLFSWKGEVKKFKIPLPTLKPPRPGFIRVAVDSDSHGRRYTEEEEDALGNPDLHIFAGDLSNSPYDTFDIIRAVKNVLPRLEMAMRARKRAEATGRSPPLSIFTGGNHDKVLEYIQHARNNRHDLIPEEWKKELESQFGEDGMDPDLWEACFQVFTTDTEKGIAWLIRESLEHEVQGHKLKFYAMPDTPTGQTDAFNYERGTKPAHWDDIPEDLDFFICHAPPLDDPRKGEPGEVILSIDKATGIQRLGSKELWDTLNKLKKKPKFIISGHTHASNGNHEITWDDGSKSTWISNPAPRGWFNWPNSIVQKDIELATPKPPCIFDWNPTTGEVEIANQWQPADMAEQLELAGVEPDSNLTPAPIVEKDEHNVFELPDNLKTPISGPYYKPTAERMRQFFITDLDETRDLPIFERMNEPKATDPKNPDPHEDLLNPSTREKAARLSSPDWDAFIRSMPMLLWMKVIKATQFHIPLYKLEQHDNFEPTYADIRKYVLGEQDFRHKLEQHSAKRKLEPLAATYKERGDPKQPEKYVGHREYKKLSGELRSSTTEYITRTTKDLGLRLTRGLPPLPRFTRV